MLGRPAGTARPTRTTATPISEDIAGRFDEPTPDRCDSCKVPERTEKLLTFELRLAGKPAGAWTLCQKCWEWRNRRLLDPDPRHVEEDAA